MKYLKFRSPSTTNRLCKLRSRQSMAGNTMHNLAVQCLEELYNNDYDGGKAWKDIIEKYIIIATNIHARLRKP